MKLSLPIFRLKRQARLLSREAAIPLHEALDRLARREGFRSWSLLAAEASRLRPGERLLPRFAPGDLALLAARPGHGKTLLGLELAVAAVRAGRSAFFFTLEETEAGISQRLRSLGLGSEAARLVVDTSDDIAAGFMIDRMGAAPRPALAVIDYLQLLDQQRRKPQLSVQVRQLHDFAAATGATVVAISQIDRAFEDRGRKMPEPSDIRQPNPLDLGLFSTACFLHDGEVRFGAMNAAA
ncbi:DNA helicase [Jiella mangrovi]|uniref:AAA family ATPase n=1 Tax=Jiella mangrovi TaxID=2821407 RepID=A0ABS4BKX8_9HYPH|nr:DNA helicase [Jiella mangrovi]MBP0616819.1 AAA family ATPase [Jiella mangrovi]